MNYNGVTYKTGQGNNAYIFPGVALGVITTGMYHIREEVFLLAAQTVADNVSEEQLEVGSVYPTLADVREVSLQIATEISKYAYEKGKRVAGVKFLDKIKILFFFFRFSVCISRTTR